MDWTSKLGEGAPKGQDEIQNGRQSMRIVQFQIPQRGQRVGIVDGDIVQDVTACRPKLKRVYDVFFAARRSGQRLAEFVDAWRQNVAPSTLSYSELQAAKPDGDHPFLCPPLTHEDPCRILITGTGLTHTGGMQSRDQMHAEDSAAESASKTDSAKMFEMGLQGGKPPVGQRGAAPEWFYKGNGTNLRGPGESLELPAFALDGGEEPELVGCYIIDDQGVPCRLGFALGIEWSDHATEKINYLYLAPSKLRTCSIGPELNTDCDFHEVKMRCTVSRDGKMIYDSGKIFSGEQHMCHTLANCEDHHFKYRQHRQPGDIHLHFFGTSKLSYSTRKWKYQDGDEIHLAASGFSASLVNPVRDGDPMEGQPIVVESA